MLRRITITQIKCAFVKYSHDWSGDVEYIKLKVNYTNKELQHFLDSMSIRPAYIDGTIWLNDGRWLARYDDDGQEGWYIESYPEIPKELLK